MSQSYSQAYSQRSGGNKVRKARVSSRPWVSTDLSAGAKKHRVHVHCIRPHGTCMLYAIVSYSYFFVPSQPARPLMVRAELFLWSLTSRSVACVSQSKKAQGCYKCGGTGHWGRSLRVLTASDGVVGKGKNGYTLECISSVPREQWLPQEVRNKNYEDMMQARQNNNNRSSAAGANTTTNANSTQNGTQPANNDDDPTSFWGDTR
eukprot:1181850-Prorocentrum_minimum.AAC.3